MAHLKIKSIVLLLYFVTVTKGQGATNEPIALTTIAAQINLRSLSQSSMGIIEPTPSPDECPETCVCNFERHTVSCNNKDLTNIPTGIPDYVWFLSLNGNRFQNLSGNAFADLPNLVSLQLVQSAISYVHPKAFNGLSQLRKLDLRSNSLEDIQTGTFSGLTAMTELELQGNSMEAIASSPFQGLTLLNKVSLDGNLISNFPSNLFSDNPNLEVLSLRFCRFNDVRSLRDAGLANLKELYLSGNAITNLGRRGFAALPSLRVLHLSNMFPTLDSIDEGAFQGLDNLKTLDVSDNSLRRFGVDHIDPLTNSLELLKLRNNPWNCDCQMGELLERLRETTIDYYDPFWRCNTPADLRGQIVFAVFPVDKFACVPFVFTAPQNTTVDFKDSAFFSISFEGDPTPEVQWYLPEGDQIGGNVGSAREYVLAGGTVMVIRQAMEYHSGEYRVIVENSRGKTTVFFEVLVLNIPPTTRPATSQMPPVTTGLPPPCIYAPIQLRVTGITDTSATLLWTAYNSPDLIGYIVHQNEFGNQDSYHATLTNSTESSRTLEYLKPDSYFILCVTVYLMECPSFTSLDQCAQIKTKGNLAAGASRAVNHRNELMILAAASVATTLLLVATMSLIFWTFKQPRSQRKYEFQPTDDTVRFTDLKPVDFTAMRLDKRSPAALATTLESNGSIFTYDHPSIDLHEEHEYETPNEYPMKTFQAEMHKQPLPPDLPEDEPSTLDLAEGNEPSTLEFTHNDPGLATLLSELRFQQDISDVDSDDGK